VPPSGYDPLKDIFGSTQQITKAGLGTSVKDLNFHLFAEQFYVSGCRWVAAEEESCAGKVLWLQFESLSDEWRMLAQTELKPA